MEHVAGVRSYRSTDRRAVREISCDTADIGDPVDRFFPDREAVADVLVGYYIDQEPDLLWVAEREGRVVGYLTGCLDTRRSRRAMRKMAMKAAVVAVRRGVLWRVRTWHLLVAAAGTVLLGGSAPAPDLDRYPAHFHINLRPEARGSGLGRRLVERFRDQVDAARVAGMHVVTRGDNAAGRQFFEAMGFRLLHERLLILPDGRWFKRTSTAAYGWRREE
ncbi:MAG: GNAT family N-acetyltransferase [Phycisphaerales bacterium]